MRPARLSLALALATALPAAAGALDWSARAGLIYSQDERTRPGTPTISTPRLDVDLGLDMRGFVHQPDALTWSGGVDYRRLSVGGDVDNVENRLEYRLQANAFPRATSPISFTAFASRHEGDGTAPGIDYGGTTNTFGGNLALRMPRVPAFEFGYARSDSVVTSSLRPDSFLTRETFTAGTAHSGAIHGVTGTYRGTISDGTFDTDNFGEHRVDLGARVRLAPRTHLHVADYFYRRDPTVDSQFNPKQRLNLLNAVLRLEGDPGRGQQQISYNYSAAATETTVAAETRALNVVTYQIDRPVVGERWWIIGTAGLSFDQRTRNSVREQLAGETLTAALSRRESTPDRSWELHAGPSFGALQPFDGTVQYGFGGAGGGAYQRMLGYMTWGAQYSLSYADAVGSPGTSFFQQAQVNMESAAGLGRLRGTLIGESNRTNDQLFGSRASRSLLLRGEYALRLTSVWIDANLRDGLASALRTTINGDGLLLGPSYDVHSRTVTVGARGTVGALFGSTSIRLTSSDTPDRPVQDDLELRGEAGVRVGAFGMSIEDRYITALEDSGARGTINIFYFRVYRLFGSGR